ncbi:MAG: hypothetical protein Kow0069_19560 [Promethearchaeota archaeon]
MERYCPHCGSSVGPNARFCVKCGKPLLSKPPTAAVGELNLPNISADGVSVPPGVAGEPSGGDRSGDEREGEGKGKDEGKGEEKKKGKKKRKEDRKGKGGEGKRPPPREPPEPLDPKVIEQLEVYCELDAINEKKAKLKEKLAEVEKLLKREEYDYDPDFKEQVDLKFLAIKKYKEELDAQEEAVAAKKDEEFPLVALPPRIERLKEQIVELKRQTKFKKIDRDVFEELNAEYEHELKGAQETLARLVVKVNVYLQKSETELNMVRRELRRVKARWKTREIGDEERQEQEKALRAKISAMEARLASMRRLVERAKI